MRSTHAAIHPLLISTLTGQALSSISEKPTVSQLPGVLTKLIAKHKKKIELKFEPNKQFLICGHCGSRRKYDLGLVAYNLESWKENEGELAGPSPSTSINIFNYMQTTGYFRCKQCNGAGDWKLKSSMFTFELFAGILADLEGGNSRYRAGEMALYDASTHKWQRMQRITF